MKSCIKVNGWTTHGESRSVDTSDARECVDHSDCVSLGVPSITADGIQPNAYGLLHLTRAEADRLAESLTTGR